MTFDRSQISALLADLGPMDEEILDIVGNDEGSWTISCADDLNVLLESDANSGGYVLSARIGHPPIEREAEVLRTLMSFHLLWRQTSGMRAARTADDNGELILLSDWPAERASPAELLVLLQQFCDFARAWAAYVKDAGQPPTLPSSVAMAGLLA